MEVVESNITGTHISQTTSQHEPFSNGFPMSAVLAPLAGNAAVGTFENNGIHLKIPFHAENGEFK